MNSLGVALAADSAATVTSARGRKVFNSADKLFMLSQLHPVGVMIYENASLLGVPWEAILKVFRRKLGDRQFARLEDYVCELIRFLNEDRVLAPQTAQDHYYQRAVEKLFHGLAKKQQSQLRKAWDEGGMPDEGEVAREVILAAREEWRGGQDTACFDPAIGTRLASRFSGQITARRPGGFSLGRQRFAKINAVEGISLSYTAQSEFEEDDRLGLTPEQRRDRIIEKYRRPR